MSVDLMVVLVLLPYAILAMPLAWTWLRSRRTTVRWFARSFLVGMTILLGAGDILNGTDVPGFDSRLLLLGVACAIGLHLIVWVAPVRRRIATGASRAIEAIREDFREAHPLRGRTSSAWSPFLFLAFLLFFYGFYITYSTFNYQLKYEVFGFLDMLKTTASQADLVGLTSGDHCVSPRAYRLVSRLWLPFASSADPETYFHVCFALTAGIFAIRWTMHRGWPLWLLVVGHLFYLAIAINPEYEFTRTADFEIGFALLFLVCFVLTLRATMTPGWLWLLGFVCGLAFLQKELAILGLAMVAYRLADADLPRRRLVALIASASAGFLLPTLAYHLPMLRCGIAEGPYHLPFLWYRGALLQTQWTQADVMAEIDGGRTFGVWEMVLARLSFQTLGEVVVGGAAQLGHHLLLGVFPLAYFIANFRRDHLGTISLFLVVGFLVYGVTHWKGGDSSDPLYTMLPFGYVFSGPYFVRLVAGTLRIAKSGLRGRSPLRSLYIPLLLIINLWFLGQQVAPVVRTVRDMVHLSGLSTRGATFSVEPAGKEAELRDLLLGLRDRGLLGRWLFLGACRPPEVPRFLVHSDLDRRLAMLDIRHEILDALRNTKIDWIRRAFQMMTYLQAYRLEGVDRLHVLACLHDSRHQPPHEPLLHPGPWLGGCAEVLWADPEETGTVLLAFHLERCQRYLPRELLEGRHRFDRFPVLDHLWGP